MILLKLPFKSLWVHKWRSMTIGIFVFFVSFYMLFFTALITSVTERMENAIIHALTGEIQIRPIESGENDMVAMGSTWDEVVFFSGEQVNSIEKMLRGYDDIKGWTGQVCQNVLFVSDTDQQPAMVIGGNPEIDLYKKAVELIEGRYLDPNNTHEVILSKSQAENLKVKVEDTIGVLTQTHGGYTVDSALTVVGIGDVTMLSSFGFSVAYTDLSSARELMGFEGNEASDLIVFAEHRKDALRLAEKLETDFKGAGTITEQARISTWKTMGGFIKGIVGMTKGIFFAFIGVLMLIVSLLIANIVYLMIMERYQDIGTLRAIGFSKGRVLQMFVSEILLIIGFFSILGTLTGTVVILVFSRVGLPAFFQGMEFIMGNRLYLRFDIRHIFPVIVVQFIVGLLACLYPSYRASTVQPTEALSQT